MSTPDVTVSRLTLFGTVAPGTSPGILSVAGDVVFADNDVFRVEIGGATAGTNNNNHDQLAATGSVTIGGNVTLSVSSWMGFVPSVMTSYTIIARTGGAGTFAGLPEGAILTNFLGSGRNATITYAGGDGDDVVLTQLICVTNTNDSGAGSLRQAILNANASAGIDDVCFNIPGAGPHSIAVLSQLPTVTDAVIIDGTSEPDFVSSPVIELNGSGAGAGVSGLVITAGNSTVHGLVINRFSGSGLILRTNGGSVVQGNYIGTDVSGLIDLGNSGKGVFVDNSPGNVIGGTSPAARNIISGNQSDGVYVAGLNNLVQGNYIGTDKSGTLALGNSGDGVRIEGGLGTSSGTIVGGTAVGAGNVISSNSSYGVQITTGATGRRVEGNLIGTNAAGTAVLPNFAGVAVTTPNNTIGGAASGARNIISGNTSDGIFIGGAGATGNVVQGNYIGTDVTGTIDLGNTVDGIQIVSASNNTIGGTTAAERNVISGNNRDGIRFVNGINGGVVQGNYIGLNALGTGDLGNSANGVNVANCDFTTIGGTGAGAGNVISGNNSNGIRLSGMLGGVVQGNFIGTNAAGTATWAIPSTASS